MREDIIYVNHGKGLPFEITITGTSYCDGTYRITRNHSTVLCIEYIVSGSGVVMCEGKTFYPKTGDMYVLPVGRSHEYYSYSEDAWEKIWFNATGELCERILDMYNIGRNFFYEGCDGSEYIRKIHAICSDSKLSDEEKHNKSAVCALELIQFLAREKTHSLEKSDRERMKEYINNHLSDDIGVGDIAEAAELSVSQTIRAFKKEFGITPYEYFTERRIEKAKLLLAGTNMKVKDIAAEVGFCDEHYFSGVFKRRCAKTPGEFRKNRNRWDGDA